MKIRITALAMLLVALLTCLIACCDSESAEVKKIHEDSITYLNDEGMLRFESGAVFNSKWMNDNFKESYIKFEDDGDFEMYILLIQNTDTHQQNIWYYVQVLGGYFVEAKEISQSWATRIETKLGGWAHTDKIGKKWR